jgi:hypothetical protein
MFVKRSRYYRLNDTTFPDKNGIARQCKELRRISQIDGRFLHSIESSDRLDHLAYKYYKQSLHWWRICDANPAFRSPLALLGKTATADLQLTLLSNSTAPDLSALYAGLLQIRGVEYVRKNSAQGLPTQSLFESSPLFVLSDALIPVVRDSVFSQTLHADLALALQVEGIDFSGLEFHIFELDAQSWQVESNYANRILRLRHVAMSNVLSVSECAVQYALDLQLRHNKLSVAQSTIVAFIESLDFIVEEISTIGRAGQSVLIPPRYTGIN